ncbi:MAG: hypothetical protein K9G62_00195 [Alphaproteobacteria bacterium]|nr:hypothetical protein [Alphaproteobacteria bacterium]
MALGDKEHSRLTGDATGLTGGLRGSFAAANKLPSSDLPTFEELTEKRRNDYALNGLLNGEGEADFAGLMGRYGVAEKSFHGVTEHKRKEEDFYRILIRQAILESLQRLNEHIQWLTDQIELLRLDIAEIDADMAKNTGRIDEIKLRRAAGEDALSYFNKYGVLERNPDGTLKNPRAQALLDDYKARTGKEPEDDYIAAYFIQEQLKFDKAEEDGCRKDNDHLEEKRTEKEILLEQMERDKDRFLRERDRILKIEDPAEQAKQMEALNTQFSQAVLEAAQDSLNSEDKDLKQALDEKPHKNETIETSADELWALEGESKSNTLTSTNPLKPMGP